MLFAGHSEEKLELMYKSMDLSCTFPQFMKMYEYATSKPYNFLYVDKNASKFCKNFTEPIDPSI